MVQVMERKDCHYCGCCYAVPLISWVAVTLSVMLIHAYMQMGRKTALQKCLGFSGAKKVSLAPELFKSCILISSNFSCK